MIVWDSNPLKPPAILQKPLLRPISTTQRLEIQRTRTQHTVQIYTPYGQPGDMVRSAMMREYGK